MRILPKLPSSVWVCGALAAGLVGASAPAFAQTAEELTVTGRYGPTGEVKSLTQAVSYGDLDLTTDTGRAALKQRIKDTAHDLCVRLGEPPNLATPPVPSCQQAAIDSAWDQQQVAIAEARPRNLYAAASPPPAPAATAPMAPAASSFGSQASVTVQTVTNGPVPDTRENRRKYGGPMSSAGKRTAPAGN